MLVAIAAAIGPALDEHPSRGKNIAAGLTAEGTPLPPSAAYPMGTDSLGRCVSARVFDAARLSLAVAAGATILAVLIGLLVGLAAGYAGGTVDSLLMRFTDVLLSFPFLLIAIALAAALGAEGSSALSLVAVLGFVGWTGLARVVRAEAQLLRGREFVQAARALGAGHSRIVVRHILRNLIGPVVVLATLLFAQMILAESALAYLGLGVPPPSPTWGRMLHESLASMRGAPWMAMAPGIAIFVTVLGVNLLGDGFRAVLNPRRAS